MGPSVSMNIFSAHFCPNVLEEKNIRDSWQSELKGNMRAARIWSYDGGK
jgi:hypothetical protein